MTDLLFDMIDRSANKNSGGVICRNILSAAAGVDGAAALRRVWSIGE
jgi:hypothetical protein